MSKETTSNVEQARERFEEPITTYGSPIRAERIWVDSTQIPDDASRLVDWETAVFNTAEGTYGEYQYISVKKLADGAARRNLLTFYRNVSLAKVKGTSNCYEAPEVKNILTESFGSYYRPTIYLDGNPLAYDVGHPLFDVGAGTLYFQDEEFVSKINNRKITLSYYRYEGRLGTTVGGDLGNPDLPFRDDIAHFKDAEVDDGTSLRRATFKVRGDNKNTNYILPPDDGKMYHKGDVSDTAVILTQENLESTLWDANIRISGGRWESNAGIKRVYKYEAQKIGDTVVDEGEDTDENNDFTNERYV